MAVLPYVLVVAVFGVAKLWTLGVNMPALLASTDVLVPWPGLAGRLLDADGTPISGTVYKLQWLSSPAPCCSSPGCSSPSCTRLDGDGRFRLSLSTPSSRSATASTRCAGPP